jgi:glycosyltransferase involved in cell wall biosynthesis
MLGYLPDAEAARVVAAAYAMVFPSYFEGFGVPLLEAMQSDVPVIASNTSSLPEVGEDAALYCSPDDPQHIAEQMKLLYKDEQLRTELVAKGRIVAAKYSWQKTCGHMWDAIQQALST